MNITQIIPAAAAVLLMPALTAHADDVASDANNRFAIEEISLSARATDTAYIALMNENGFGIPSQFAGYDNGFQYWAAVRGGVMGREGGLTFESLSAALKRLGRDDNMMMPTVTVKSTVTRPTGSDIPAANFPR